MVKRGKSGAAPKRRGDRFDLRFFDVTEKLDRQMKVRHRNHRTAECALEDRRWTAKFSR